MKRKDSHSLEPDLSTQRRRSASVEAAEDDLVELLMEL